MYFIMKTLFGAGIKAKKMHPVLKFNQSEGLKPFVEFNT